MRFTHQDLLPGSRHSQVRVHRWRREASEILGYDLFDLTEMGPEESMSGWIDGAGHWRSVGDGRLIDG